MKFKRTVKMLFISNPMSSTGNQYSHDQERPFSTQIMSPKETGILEKKGKESGIVFTLLITDVTLQPKFIVIHGNLRINTFIQRMCYKSSFQGSSVCMLLSIELQSCVDEQQSTCDHPAQQCTQYINHFSVAN